MQNDMRDRLMDLLFPASADLYENKIGIPELADHLIANGVILPPCKVGDTIYTIFEGKIGTLEITQSKTEENAKGVSRYYDAKNNFLLMPFADCHIGKTVFLTKDQAEQKLKEMRVENGNL